MRTIYVYHVHLYNSSYNSNNNNNNNHNIIVIKPQSPPPLSVYDRYYVLYTYARILLSLLDAQCIHGLWVCVRNWRSNCQLACFTCTLGHRGNIIYSFPARVRKSILKSACILSEYRSLFFICFRPTDFPAITIHFVRSTSKSNCMCMCTFVYFVLI
jgi:hypothetical protein